MELMNWGFDFNKSIKLSGSLTPSYPTSITAKMVILRTSIALLAILIPVAKVASCFDARAWGDSSVDWYFVGLERDIHNPPFYDYFDTSYELVTTWPKNINSTAFFSVLVCSF